jgi:hypothetical protein
MKKLALVPLLSIAAVAARADESLPSAAKDDLSCDEAFQLLARVPDVRRAIAEKVRAKPGARSPKSCDFSSLGRMTRDGFSVQPNCECARKGARFYFHLYDDIDDWQTRMVGLTQTWGWYEVDLRHRVVEDTMRAERRWHFPRATRRRSR